MTYHLKSKEGNVLLNDTFNTFYLWLHGIGHMVKDDSDTHKHTVTHTDTDTDTL